MVCWKKHILQPILTSLLAVPQEQQQQASVSNSQGQPALSLLNLSCSHDGGNVYQLKDVNYFLPRNGKIGLVGRNGCGKSTLLQILAHSCGCASIKADDLPYFSGTIETGKGCRVAYVEQEPFSDIDSDEVLVGDALFGVTSLNSNELQASGRVKTAFEAVQQYKRAMLTAETDPDALGKATSDMDSVANAWQVLAKADEVMQKLGVKNLENMPICNLSGGEKKRVALSSALVQEPNIIMLDEVRLLLAFHLIHHS